MPGILRNLLDNLWGLATSDTIGVTVAEPPPLVEVLTISADKMSIQTGEKVTFTGRYTVDGRGVSREISLYVNNNPVMDMMCDSDGYYTISWSTPNAGSYNFYTRG